MMNKIRIIVAAIIVCMVNVGAAASIYAQEFRWAQLGTGGRTVDVQGLAVDSGGAVYVVGTFNGASPEGSNFSGVAAPAFGDEDIFIAKYDAGGALLWLRTAGGLGSDRCHGVCVDPDGAVYIVGSIASGSFTFDTTTFSGPDTRLAFIAKYAPDGDVQWVRRDTGVVFSEAHAVVCAPDGNIILAGWHEEFNNRAFTAAYTAGGEQVWRVVAAGNGISACVALDADPSGAIFISGKMVGTMRLGDIELKSNNAGSFVNFIAQVAADGRPEWIVQEHHAEYDTPLALACDNAGACYFSSTTVIEHRLSKYRNDGTLLWSRVTEFPIHDISLFSPDEILLTGQFQTALQFDAIAIAAPKPDSRGIAADAFIAAMDTAGRVRWFQPIRGNKADLGVAVDRDRSGGLRLAGVFGDDWVEYDTLQVGNRQLVGVGDLSTFVASYKASPSDVPVHAEPATPLTVPPVVVPNPCRDRSVLSFVLDNPVRVHAVLCNVDGEGLLGLADAPYPAGEHRMTFNTGSFPSGAYYIRLRAGARTVIVPVHVVR